MTLEQFLTQYPEVRVADDVFPFARFLEQSGKRFLIDFGYENAKQIAEQEINKQLMDKRIT